MEWIAAEAGGGRSINLTPFDIQALNVILIVSVIVLGMCTGSFVSVLIYRLPKKLPFMRGMPFCPACGKRIMPYDLVPLLSYIILRGKCRSCGAGISPVYPVIELTAGATAVLSVQLYGYTPPALLFFLISAVLLAISVIDARDMIIPDGLVAALAVFSVLFYLVTGAAGASILSRAAGFFALSVPMLLLTLLVPGAFGGGDIKLIAVGGFLLGIKLTLLAGFIAALLGGAAGIYVKYIKKDVNATHIAFGQYICAGLFITLICGGEILRLYLLMLMK